jgi:hypothetical protein
MDETGVQGARYCTVGGFIASTDDWDGFERRWKAVLADYLSHVPEEHRYFHALEFYGDRDKHDKIGKYKDWDENHERKFVGRLFKAMNDFPLRLFSCTVDTVVFRLLTEDERQWLTGGEHNGMKWKKHGAPTKPYFVPFMDCVVKSAMLTPKGSKVYPVMSRQDQYRMKALELYDLALNSNPAMQFRPQLGDDLVFSDPKKVAALQVADLAVYWIGKQATYIARSSDRKLVHFRHKYEMRRIYQNARSRHDFPVYDFNGLMLALCGANRHIKTSYPTLDQQLPSLPIERRREVLSVMRKVDFRPFLDQWKPSGREDHG